MEKNSPVRTLGLDKKGLERARAEGEREFRRSPVSLAYSKSLDTLTLKMPTGTKIVIPREWMGEFRDLSKADMKNVRLGKFRDSLEIDELDIHISAMGLLRDAVFGDDPYARAGRVTSPAKRRAARRNGAKGGRPKTRAQR